MSNLKDNPVYKFVNVFKGYTIAEKRMIKYRSDSVKEIKQIELPVSKFVSRA